MNSIKQDKKLVLIAEDDSDEQYFITNSVKEYDFPVKILFVEHGQALLEAIKSGPVPALVLLDLNMPVLDGMQTLKILKTSRDYSPIPVVVYTTSNSEFDIRESYRFGANSFVTKPTGFQEIKHCLHGLFHYWFNVAALDTNND